MKRAPAVLFSCVLAVGAVAGGITALVSTSPANAATVPGTLFNTQTPPVRNPNDTNPVNLGMMFSSNTAGTINAIRFYKSSVDTGTHVGDLWDMSGNLLASVTFPKPTNNGWQQANLSTPVAIDANTNYVVSYYAPHGGYSYATGGFNSAVTNGTLTAPANSSVTPGNGLFVYNNGPAFPNADWQADNYYVDVVFQAGSPPPPAVPAAPTSVTATAGDGTANVTWSEAPANPAVSSYTVTDSSGDTVTSNSTSAAFSGLTDGTSYTFTVTATNSVGTSTPSDPSNVVTPEPPPPPMAPPAPTNVVATAGDTTASVTWQEGASDDPVTSYTVTGSDGSTQTVTSPPAQFTGLTDGQSYTFTVTATSNAGTSAPSNPSNAVVPNAGPPPPPPGLLPGETVLPNGAPSYDFGTQSTINYGSPNVDNTPSVQQALKAGDLTLMREWLASWNNGPDIPGRMATISNSGMSCMANLSDGGDAAYNKTAVQQAYAAGCRIFEFGNEPDNSTNEGSIATYVNEWNAQIPALRAEAPGAVFGGPVLMYATSNDGHAGSYPDDMAYFLAKTAQSGVRADFVSYHDYACTGYTNQAQCISDTPGNTTDSYNHVISEEQQYYGGTVPTGISEWNFDPGTGTLGNWANDSHFMFTWTETMLQSIENNHMAFANEFTTLNFSGYGALDMFDDSTQQPKPQYYAMVDMGEKAGSGSTVAIPTF